MAVVEIYTTALCGYCHQAKQLLSFKGVEFSEIRVDNDPAQMQVMLQRSNGRRTVPQIFINGEGIGGFQELLELEQQGLLDKKLAQ